MAKGQYGLKSSLTFEYFIKHSSEFETHPKCPGTSSGSRFKDQSPGILFVASVGSLPWPLHVDFG